MRVEPLTASIGAELVGVNLAHAAHDDGLFNEIRSLLLKHKVLFLRDQDISRSDHVAFARRFGELEDHPVAGSHPEHPGLVQIYKNPDQPIDRYENAWHTDATWRENPPLGCVLRCVECPPVGGDTIWANMVLAYRTAAAARQERDRRPARAPQHRGQLRRRHADRKAPGAQGPVPGPGAPGGARASGNRREGAVRQRLHHALHQLPHAGARALRPGLQPRCGRSPALPDQPGVHPRVPGALALEAQQHGDLGQPQHPALRRDGLRPLPSQDGAGRHRRRQALWRRRQACGAAKKPARAREAALAV